MTSSAQQMYPQQQQQPQHLQYHPSTHYQSPYSPSAVFYANSLISTYGQLPPPAAPHQPYVYDQPAVGAKRSSDDVVQAVDLLSKRPRPDSGGTLPFYPQRPGEKVCAFYMTTRTCSFGFTCKFDHPTWVPFGGIPNWKEVTGSANTLTVTDPATLPQRPGQPNCPFYMKTGECKYGARCKFNHPLDRHAQASDSAPQNKEESSPAAAAQNGEVAGSEGITTTTTATTGSTPPGATAGTTSTPVVASSTAAKGSGKVPPLNSKGLPLRQNETECTYYMKTGSCKFGATCRFHHPEVTRAGARPVVPFVAGHSRSNAAPAISYPNEYGMLVASLHPQRPGAPDCTYYLKTGECSYGAACKFNHPLSRQPSNQRALPKLTLAGLPRREGETVCAYYMKTGTCKYGSTCRFDHPPPGEVAAKAAAEANKVDGHVESFDVHQAPGVSMPHKDDRSAPDDELKRQRNRNEDTVL